MVPDEGYYGDDKRRRIEKSYIPFPPPPPPQTFPGMVYPPRGCVGASSLEAYSCNYNRRGGRGGRSARNFGRGEGGRRGRGKEGRGHILMVLCS